MARALAILSGGLILVAVAHVTVVSTGGYGTPHSYVTIAIVIGAAGGGVFSGMAWTHGRRVLAVCLMCCIFAGEAYQFLATADRLITCLEAAQAPLRAENDARARAEKRVRDAKAALTNAPTTSARLQKAEAAKAAADAAVIEKSAERGCLANCRQLLQDQVDAAALEVRIARAEVDGFKDKADATLVAATQALDSIKLPQSATPFADRIGVAPWVIDLLRSAFGSIAANGLACCLMIFGAHYHSGTGSPARWARAPEVVPLQHMARFGVERLRPAHGETTDLADIEREYRAWRPGSGTKDAAAGRALAELFSRAGITVTERGSRLIAHGVAIRNARKLVA